LAGLPFKIERFDRKLISVSELRKNRRNIALKLMIIDNTEVSWESQEDGEDLEDLPISPIEPEPLNPDNDFRGYYKHSEFSPLSQNVYIGKINLSEDLTDSLALFKLFFAHDQVKAFVKATNAYAKSIFKGDRCPLSYYEVDISIGSQLY
jgi:hypothetical protein